MSFRAWLSVFTLTIIAVIVFFSRHELAHAWRLLEQVNIWILLLLVPVQAFVYYASGEIMFSYLRAKKLIAHISPLGLARLSLEMNFVNHILPSGGVSGMSYMGWRMRTYGISPSRSTMAQVVRYAMSLAAFVALLAVAVVVVTIDGSINRWMILGSSILVTGTLAMIVLSIYVLSSPRRMERCARWSARTINQFVRRLTLGHRQAVVNHDTIGTFFEEMHVDYVALRQEKKVLIRPFLWGLLFTIADVSLFVITFLALGFVVNPAPILIAYGVAALAGFFVMTPGGAGAYEAIMVAFLAVAGLGQGTAIAGIVLTRVILLLGTILFGYLFYQQAIMKYGKKQHDGPPALR